MPTNLRVTPHRSAGPYERLTTGARGVGDRHQLPQHTRHLVAGQTASHLPADPVAQLRGGAVLSAAGSGS
ncbi:hypothetical protein ABR737_00125 [Streptomyces sp. Edi2]|uniref:hypothetical protein n=1 Tax=Streptomyces sp. Edi2 TaxID=3162528 RepID=UPI003305C6C8